LGGALFFGGIVQAQRIGNVSGGSVVANVNGLDDFSVAADDEVPREWGLV
jgi:hypothetical protein